MRHAIVMMLCLFTLLIACSSQSQEEIQPQTGVISDGEYHYAPIGWRISLPWRWHVSTPKALQAALGKGRSLIEKAVGSEVVDTETQLLYARLNAKNQFTSSISPFDKTSGTEAEQVSATFDVILAAYAAGHYDVRSSRGTERVGGVRFDLMHVSMLDPTGSHEILQQQVYVGRIGSNWLIVSITTADWIPRQLMLNAWRNSHFSTPGETD